MHPPPLQPKQPPPAAWQSRAASGQGGDTSGDDDEGEDDQVPSAGGSYEAAGADHADEQAPYKWCDVIFFGDEDGDAASTFGKPSFRDTRNQVVEILKSPGVKERLAKLARDDRNKMDKNVSCMEISGGRFELFLGAWHRV
jgi:hypothetical protein